MTRRTRRPLIAVSVAVAIFLVVAWLAWPRTAINQTNFERIQMGMSLAEVEEILGGPARDESSGHLVADAVVNDAELGPEERAMMAKLRLVTFTVSWGRGPRFWTSNQLMIRVELDANERVMSMDALPVHSEESLLDKLRRWLRL
jgi:hypothetical protein